MRVLFLDDMSERQESFESAVRKLTGPLQLYLVSTATEALIMFNTLKFDAASLDHDLGPGMDGTALLRRVHPSKLPRNLVVHSLNPVGARRMCQMSGAAYWPYPDFGWLRQL